MIRLAGLDDLDFIMRHATEFNKSYVGIPLNESKTRAWITRNIVCGVALVSDTGFICGLFVDDPCRDYTALVETGWYDTGRSGMKLLNEFIKHGKEHGVQEVRMTTLGTSPEYVNHVLGSRGFELVERSYRLTT